MFRFFSRSFTTTSAPTQIPIKTAFQYCSDLHVDVKGRAPLRIQPIAETLLIAGDVGSPFCPSFKTFFDMVAGLYKTVLFVPGNHDYGHGCIYNPVQTARHRPQLKSVCGLYPNVHVLENKVYYYSPDIVIAGTPLYSRLSPRLKEWKDSDQTQYMHQHNKAHEKCVEFIRRTCEDNKNKKVVVLSHYAPTFALMDEKHKKYESVGSKWFTDLEDVMAQHPNICSWVCGHTHTVKEVFVQHPSKNNKKTHCCVNAHGYDFENKTPQVLSTCIYQ